MSPARIDRAFVFWIAATLTVQVVSAVLLCSRAFDPSPTTTLLAGASVLLAVAVAVGVPGRVVRLTQRLARCMGFTRPRVPGLTEATSTRVGGAEARAMSQLAAVLAFVAAGCGLLSILAMRLASGGLRLIERGFLFPAPTWHLLTFGLMFAAMLPLGLGVSVALLSHTVLRRGSGRDTYAGVFRGWLWAAAVGSAVTAVLWWAGANLLYVQFAAVASLALAATAITQRKKTTVRLRRPLQPLAAPSRRRRLALAGFWAALTTAMMVQLRFIEAVGDACAGGKSAFVAFSLCLLAFAVGRTDARSNTPSTRQLLAVCLLLPAGLLVQAALALTAVAARAEGRAALTISAGVLAVACQLPLAAGAGMVVSAQRRRFASAGRRGRQYISTVSGGAGFGVLVYLLLAPPMPGGVSAATGALVLCAAAIVAFIGLSTRGGDQLRWACCGGALLLALTVLVTTSAKHVRSTLGPDAIGLWLTRTSAGPGGIVDVTRSDHLHEEIRRILSEHRGRWWVVAPAVADVPAKPWGVSLAVSSPDVSTADAELRKLLAPGSRADWFEAMRRDRPYYDGLLFSPLPADHGGAWRCYNVESLVRTASLVHPGGVVAIRVRSSDAERLLQVVRGFAEVVGDGWVAVSESERGLDALIAGPAGVVDAPTADGLSVASVREILSRRPDVQPMQLIAMGGVRIPGRGRKALLKLLSELSAAQR
ncbi:MAG: hypothetical protein ACOC9S_00340 [Planctomycetota bacterium]